MGAAPPCHPGLKWRRATMPSVSARKRCSMTAHLSAPKPVSGAAPILEVRGLVKHFPIGGGLRLRRNAGFIQAVDGVDFAIHKGETLGLVGESGCGKSTVARTLMRLEEPSAGEALFHGEDIFRANAASLKNIRRRMQMIFQDPYASLNPRMRVGEIISEPWVIHADVL